MNKNFHFPVYLNMEIAPVFDILTFEIQSHVYPVWSMVWLMTTWWHKETGINGCSINIVRPECSGFRTMQKEYVCVILFPDLQTITATGHYFFPILTYPTIYGKQMYKLNVWTSPSTGQISLKQ